MLFALDGYITKKSWKKPSRRNRTGKSVVQQCGLSRKKNCKGWFFPISIVIDCSCCFYITPSIAKLDTHIH